MCAQGSHSTSTGGSSLKNGSASRSMACEEHSIRCVLTTALGCSVELEVSRYLPIESRALSAARAVRAWAEIGVAASSANGVAPSDSPRVTRPIPRRALPAASTACVSARVGGEDEARRRQLDDALELAEVLAHQRIGGRDRACRRADRHAGERQQAVLDRVARQDQQRPLALAPCASSHEPSRIVWSSASRVGQRSPAAVGGAFGDERALGGRPRPNVRADRSRSSHRPAAARRRAHRRRRRFAPPPPASAGRTVSSSPPSPAVRVDFGGALVEKGAHPRLGFVGTLARPPPSAIP